MFFDVLRTSLYLGIALLVGCVKGPSNPVEFKGGDFPEPPISFKVSITDRVVGLSWNHAAPSQVATFRIFRQDSTNRPYRKIGFTDKFSFEDSNLQNGRQYRYKVASVGVNGLEGRQSDPVTAIPAIFSIEIGNNQEFTNTLNVLLSFGAPASTSLVQISNDSSFSGSQWVNFSSTKSWVLNIGDGVKTVYAKFRDSRDVEIVKPVDDSIILDTEATIRQFLHNGNGRILTPADTLHLVLNAGEAGGKAFVNINNVQLGIPLFDDGTNGDTVARDGIYELDYKIPTGPEVENTLVVGIFTDRAGNVATNLTASSGRVSVRRLPTPVTLLEVRPKIGSSRKLNLFWSQNFDNDFSNYRIFRSLTPGVDGNSPLVTIIQSKTTLTFTDSTLVPNTTYYYRVFVFDITGLSF